jgi:hypothetical protein
MELGFSDNHVTLCQNILKDRKDIAEDHVCPKVNWYLKMKQTKTESIMTE